MYLLPGTGDFGGEAVFFDFFGETRGFLCFLDIFIPVGGEGPPEAAPAAMGGEGPPKAAPTAMGGEGPPEAAPAAGGVVGGV